MMNSDMKNHGISEISNEDDLMINGDLLIY
jgi:hypothetical protein